jgi:hypothetical protein
VQVGFLASLERLICLFRNHHRAWSAVVCVASANEFKFGLFRRISAKLDWSRNCVGDAVIGEFHN